MNLYSDIFKTIKGTQSHPKEDRHSNERSRSCIAHHPSIVTTHRARDTTPRRAKVSPRTLVRSFVRSREYRET